jgi:hypothetical protein
MPSSTHGAASFLALRLVDVRHHDQIYLTALSAPMIAAATAGEFSAERTWKLACWVPGGTNPRVTIPAYAMVRWI